MWTERSKTKSDCTFIFVMMWTFIVIAQAHNTVSSTTNSKNINTPTSDNDNINNDVNNSNDKNNNNSSSSELEYFFESDIKISTMVFHRLLVTKYFQKSRNVDSVSRHLPFQVRLPREAYVTDFQLSLRRTHRSRLVDHLTTKDFKESSVSHLTRSRTKGCDEFNFRFKVQAGETVEMTLTYEQLLERSEGRYEVELYRDLCHRKHAVEDASIDRHHHGNHHYRHNKIDRFKVDVVVKETSNVNKLVTHPKDTSPMKVQSIIAGLSDMIPRSASVGDDSGKIPVMLKRRLPDEVHYQFLYKEKYQDIYEAHASSSSSPPSLSSSSKPLNWFIPKEVKVSYDVQRDNLGEVQTKGSHFVYFFAPTNKKFNQLDRDIVFLVDSSPDDVHEVHFALKKVLHSKLSIRDKFNILHFVPTVTDEGQNPGGDGSNLGRDIRRVVIGMAAGSDKNIKAASELLDDLAGFQLRGGLNYHEGSPYAEMREGILQSLDLLNRQKESDPYDTRLSLLFYITSTQASTLHLSKVEQEKILLSVEKGNRAKSIIIPVVLAQDQSAKSESNFDHLHFLDVLSILSNGSMFVHDQDSTDFESFLLRAFESTSKVLLKDLTLKAHNEKSSYGRKAKGQHESVALKITTSHYPHFKEGNELIVAGHLHNTLHEVRRLKVNSDQKSVSQQKKENFKLSVSGIGNNGFVSFDTDIAFRKSRRDRYSHEEIDEEFNDNDLEQLRTRLKKFNHMERIKTHLQLKELRQMIFLKIGRNGEEATKLQIAYREMAAQHNLLAPGKCLLLDKSLGRNSAICAIDENESSVHGVKLMTMDEPLKSFADNDPHFVVKVDGLTEHVCFDVLGRAGRFIQLLHDRNRDITVNSLIVEPRNASNDNHTYIGKISFITSEGRCLVVDTRWISFNGSRHAWNSNVTIELPGNSNTKISLLSRRLVSFEHQTLTFRVMKHHMETLSDERFHYLGFYIDNEDHLSHRASGLIGQFSRMMGHVESSSLKVKQSGSEDSISLRSRLTFKTDSWNGSTVAHLSYRRDMESGARMPCWHVGSEGHDVAGRVDRFTVPTLCHRGPAVRSAG